MAIEYNGRIAEWLLVRETLLLSDLVDENEFAQMCGVSIKALRQWRYRESVRGEVVPEPIFRPEGKMPLWLATEAKMFARKMKGIQGAVRKDDVA